MAKAIDDVRSQKKVGTNAQSEAESKRFFVTKIEFCQTRGSASERTLKVKDMSFPITFKLISSIR